MMIVTNVWAEIDSCNRKLVETLLRGDMEELAELYVADAALLPPDAGRFAPTGKASWPTGRAKAAWKS